MFLLNVEFVLTLALLAVNLLVKDYTRCHAIGVDVSIAIAGPNELLRILKYFQVAPPPLDLC